MGSTGLGGGSPDAPHLSKSRSTLASPQNKNTSMIIVFLREAKRSRRVGQRLVSRPARPWRAQTAREAKGPVAPAPQALSTSPARARAAAARMTVRKRRAPIRKMMIIQEEASDLDVRAVIMNMIATILLTILALRLIILDMTLAILIMLITDAAYVWGGRI